MLISKNQAVKRCQTLLVLMVSGLKAFYPGWSASPGKIHLSQFQGCYCDTSLLHPQVERTEQSTEACHFHLLQKFRSKRKEPGTSFKSVLLFRGYIANFVQNTKLDETVFC